MKNFKLNKDSINFYRENGYLYVKNLLSETEILELQKVTDEFLEKSRNVSNHTEVFDLEPGHSPEFPKLRRLKNPIEQHEIYNRTVRHKKILDIVSQLIGPGIRTFGNKLNMKSASFGSPVQWHQNWAFYPHTNDDLLAVGVCIDDMSIENGALMVIPGSHKGPILNHHQNGRFCGAVTDSNFSDKEAVAIELLAGGLQFTIHVAYMVLHQILLEHHVVCFYFSTVPQMLGLWYQEAIGKYLIKTFFGEKHPISPDWKS